MSPQSHEQLPASDAPLESSPPELPKNEQPTEFVNEADRGRAIEQGVSTAPASPPQDPASPGGSTQIQPQPPADQTAPSQPATLPQGWMPQIADDTDLIEKEWVDKAKEIVAHTAHDPYLQNQEINKVRREYLKKRYNKDLKQSE
jgi:hypothetical protein